MIPGPHPAPDPRPLRADARRNRDSILAAAGEVFGECGSEAQMDDVARRAGLGVGTLYRHFPTKQALMGELVRRKVRLFAENAWAVLHEPREKTDGLARLLWRNAEAIERDAATRYAMGAGNEVWAASADEQARLFPLVQSLIERDQAAGRLRNDVRVEDIPMLMCGIAGSIDRGMDWRRHLELTLDGLRPPGWSG
jgi:AcrR family transcriptional regulator